MYLKSYLLALAVCLSSLTLFAQQGKSEFEAKRLDAELAYSDADALLKDLKKDDASAYATLKKIIDPAQSVNALTSASTDLKAFREEITSAFTAIDNKENVAVILVYKGLTENSSGKFKIDQSSITSKVFHGISDDKKSFSNYLLSTKKIYFVLVDKTDKFYTDQDAANLDKRLSEAVVKIAYRKSYLRQSFDDLVAVAGTMGGTAAGASNETLKVTLIEVKASRVKDPCDVVLSNEFFKEKPTFTIHEKNIASFQIGVANSKVAANNLSISEGNLVITPNDAQKTEWKSNAYALLEIHLPRDIDNFRPLWSSLTSKRPSDKEFDFGHYLWDATIARIGVYGGLKIDKDPLSNLYAGFNYAVTKELAVNFGWTWANEYVPQVKEIGDITSVGDALKYADRKYSGAKFSIGISFSPSAFATTLGIKSKSEDSGN